MIITLDEDHRILLIVLLIFLYNHQAMVDVLKMTHYILNKLLVSKALVIIIQKIHKLEQVVQHIESIVYFQQTLLFIVHLLDLFYPVFTVFFISHVISY